MKQIHDPVAIIQKDSNKEYHSNKNYIGSTSLKKYKKSPLHFKEEIEEETEALRFGSMYHAFILEPELFDQEYFIFDDSTIYQELIGEGYKSPRSTKQYKEWFDTEMVKAGQKMTVSFEEYETLKAMKARLFSHPYAKYLLTKGQSELSHYTEREGVKVKIRPDHMHLNKRICVDLKTCQDASEDKFKIHAAELGYHISAALYADVLEQIYSPGFQWSFILVAQEKKHPYAFNIFKASPQFIAVGQFEYEILLKQHDYCQKTGIYRGYDVFCDNKFGINELDIPAFKIKDLNFYNEY